MLFGLRILVALRFIESKHHCISTGSSRAQKILLTLKQSIPELRINICKRNKLKGK
jgi:hypothetical protein